jgi:hypothetical protein
MKAKNYHFFIETFQLANSNPRKFKYRIDSIINDHHERKLLNAYWLFKRNKKNEPLEMLKKMHLEDSFYNGFRYYVIGLIQNQFCEYKFAIENLKKSINEFKESKQIDFMIHPLSILILSLGNRRDLKNMALYLDEFKSIDLKTEYRLVQRLHCEALYFYLAKEFDKAKKIITYISQKYPETYKVFAPFLNVIKFSINFSENNLEACYKNLEEYKKFHGTNVRDNYQFMKMLLDHIVLAEPLYVYENDFKDSPELYWQLEVIKSLSLGDFDNAQYFWGKLMFHNADLYQEGFVYHGELNLFSFSLLKYQQYSQNFNLDLNKVKQIQSLIERLDYIFEHLRAPISKYELMQLLWEEEYSDSLNERFKDLIKRFRRKARGQLVCHQSTYHYKKIA